MTLKISSPFVTFAMLFVIPIWGQLGVGYPFCLQKERAKQGFIEFLLLPYEERIAIQQELWQRLMVPK